ncbi:hypothetical protein VFC49_09855 [Thermococcus sp. SY098]|uniref:hypothetical protein n=1 Tax=Thermococcus sp. SY098 TaxID=3111325 RepID=UPI002D796CB7|nr:hypothetical protein [Thermococcus sp. SY098]WRS52337.1 hypothetical protein VFC49_09855 [Thermococcus sp. SY098]
MSILLMLVGILLLSLGFIIAYSLISPVSIFGDKPTFILRMVSSGDMLLFGVFILIPQILVSLAYAIIYYNLKILGNVPFEKYLFFSITMLFSPQYISSYSIIVISEIFVGYLLMIVYIGIILNLITLYYWYPTITLQIGGIENLKVYQYRTIHLLLKNETKNFAVDVQVFIVFPESIEIRSYSSMLKCLRKNVLISEKFLLYPHSNEELLISIKPLKKGKSYIYRILGR